MTWKGLRCAPLPMTLMSAPLMAALMATSGGGSATSMLFASNACMPSGAAGIGCISHRIPCFAQKPFEAATRYSRLPRPG